MWLDFGNRLHKDMVLIDENNYNEGLESWDDGLLMKAYTVDFETTTNIDDCRVWAFAACDIDNPDLVVYGNSIEDFIEWCEMVANAQLYFHNLAFDGAFIMDWLERNGWLWVEDSNSVSDMTYTTIISDVNQVYCLTLYFTPYFKVKIYDSLKIIPLSIDNMAKSYGLPISKLDLDYEKYHEPGHELNDDEKEYIKHDVQIAAHVLKIFLEQGLSKMTAGSNALADYKKICGGSKKFRMMFPFIDRETDEFIRKAYRGGFTYVNPKYQGKKLNNGIVFDVNSLYPSVMYSSDNQLLPYGNPVWFDGVYDYNPRYPLWIALVTCSFTLKKRHIPTIQLKGNFRFKQTEYIEDSDGEVTFAVTNVDWELILEHYDVKHVVWHGGFMFKGSTNLFTEYVDKWVAVKNQATIDNNKGMRQIAKLMLNSLYGKFATRTTVYSRRPEINEKDVLIYTDLPPSTRDPVYLPVGVFITSYARYKTITSAQAVYDRFIYADTDSLHLIGTDIPENIDVDNVELGKWKHESTFEEAKFLRAKCYVEKEVGEEDLTVHVSGMPARCHNQVTVDNFDFGSVYDGKLYTKRVKGGIVLIEDTIEIRK